LETSNFIELLFLASGFGIAAVEFRHLLIGGLFGMASVLCAAVAVAAYCIAWPLTGPGALGLSQLIFATYLVCAWVYLTCRAELTRIREQALPKFEEKVLTCWVSHPPMGWEHLGIQIEIVNTGAETALYDWTGDIHLKSGTTYSIDLGFYANDGLTEREIVKPGIKLTRNFSYKLWNDEAGSNIFEEPDIQSIVIRFRDYLGTEYSARWIPESR